MIEYPFLSEIMNEIQWFHYSKYLTNNYHLTITLLTVTYARTFGNKTSKDESIFHKHICCTLLLNAQRNSKTKETFVEITKRKLRKVTL